MIMNMKAHEMKIVYGCLNKNKMQAIASNLNNINGKKTKITDLWNEISQKCIVLRVHYGNNGVHYGILANKATRIALNTQDEA